MEFLKKAGATAESRSAGIRKDVRAALEDIENRRESAVGEMARRLDGWEGDFVLGPKKKARLLATVPQRIKDDLRFAYDQIRGFAMAQKESLREFQVEAFPGVKLGQRVIPMDVAGCYVPGGRYAHACSALMSVGTAKAAGVPFVVAASPPHDGSINPVVAMALDLAGADIVLEMGGIQAVASMALGLFTGKPADILVGPGNAYVAEAKAILAGQGRCGIDVFAGPTESAVIADKTADAAMVAVDLASQAEHGYDSPVWLFTDHRPLAVEVLQIIERVLADLPDRGVGLAAWRDYGEIILAESREEMRHLCDAYAPEHVQVITEDCAWWRDNLRSYGSLFLGAGSTVAHGDKCSGTNHILPTKKAAHHTGGLNVLKFLKVCTFQEISPEANKVVGAVASRLSRAEGMEGHARACDWRLRKLFPEENWDFFVYEHPRY